MGKVRSEGATPLIDVYVKLPTGRTCQFDLFPNDTVTTICDRVAREESVSTNQVRLKYQGKILDLSHTIGYLGIRAETILKAEIIVQREINLFVKLPGGRCEKYTAKNLDSVFQLQRQIADREKLTFTLIALKTEGRQLRGATLLDAGLADESIINVEVREASPVETGTGNESAASPSALDEIDQQQLTDIMTSFDTCGRNVEVAFSFDTTGSMYSCLHQVRQKLRQCCTRLLQDIPNIRISLIAHGDYCDQNSSYVVKSIDLTSDVQKLVHFADNVKKTCGGDSPECYEWVLRKAQQLDWSETSAKALVVIGDCEPHPVSYTDQKIDWHDELEVLTGMGVKVYGVRAQNITSAKPFYEELAERSGGCYLEFKHFSVITDMFLAVCYRESNEEQLEAFVKEVEDEGRMTEEKKEIFKQLEECVQKPTQRTTRHVHAAWWDPDIDTNKGLPEYKYIMEADKWIRYPRPEPVSNPTNSTPVIPVTPVSYSHPFDASRKRTKRRCSIM